MITRMLAVSQKIFILMLVIAGVCACESKNEEDKFLDLLAHTEFNDEEISSIFSSDWKTAKTMYGDEFKLYNIYGNGTIGVYVYNNKDENSSYYGRYVLFGFIEDMFGHSDDISLYINEHESGTIYELDTSYDNLFNKLFNGGDGIIGIVNKDKKVKSNNRENKNGYDNSNGWEHIKQTFKDDGSLLSERYQKYFEHKDGDFLAMIETDYSKFQVNISPVGNSIGDSIKIDLDDGKAFSLLTGFVPLDSQTAKALIKKLESYVKIMKSKEGNSEQIKMAQEIINKAKKY